MEMQKYEILEGLFGVKAVHHVVFIGALDPPNHFKPIPFRTDCVPPAKQVPFRDDEWEMAVRHEVKSDMRLCHLRHRHPS